jgi:arabinofuranosyltransferase
MKKKSNIITVLLYFILIITSAILCIDRVNMRIDDVFISLRYVWNITNGYGPVFNPGERIEAISNPSWVWLLSCISYIGRINDPIILLYTAKITGTLIFIFSGILFFKFLKSLLNNEYYAFLLSLIFTLNPYIASYAISGLENSLIYFLFISCLYTTNIYFLRNKVIWLLMSGFSIGLLSISRPEGIIYIISFFSSIIILKYFLKYPLKGKDIIYSVIITLLIFVSFLVWRVFYYGDIMPNTAYAKNNPELRTFLLGIRYIFGFFVYSSWALIILTSAKKVSFKNFSLNKKAMLLIAILFFLAQSAFIIYAGGDWMPTSRLALFLIPCIIIFLALITIDTISSQKSKKLFYILLSICIFINIVIARDIYRPLVSYSGLHYSKIQCIPNDITDISKKLKEITIPGKRVLINEAGLDPYLNPQLNFYDFYGLAERYIAHELKGINRSDPEYFMNSDYDYVVVICNYGNYEFINNLYNGKFETSIRLGIPSVDDFVYHKNFRTKFKPIYSNKYGIIFENRKIQTDTHTF